jgi:hypothetical protein
MWLRADAKISNRRYGGKLAPSKANFLQAAKPPLGIGASYRGRVSGNANQIESVHASSRYALLVACELHSKILPRRPTRAERRRIRNARNEAQTLCAKRPDIRWDLKRLDDVPMPKKSNSRSLPRSVFKRAAEKQFRGKARASVCLAMRRDAGWICFAR